MEMNTTKKILFRALFIALCFIALGVFFQTGQSASLFGVEPLPTIQTTLRPGVEWMTVRNLPVEASTIWQANGQVFALSRPLINSARDAALFQELLKSRLNSLPDDQILTAEITFKVPLSLTDVESLLGQGNIVSLLGSGDGGSSGRVAYPPEDVPAVVQEDFSRVFESISGGTPAPSLSFDHYVAAKVSASALVLRALAQEERVFTVDVGPIDLIRDFPNGSFSSLKDVSYDYELHVGSFCEFTLLRNRIDDLSTNGEIPEAVKDGLQDILINSEAYLNANDVASARSEMALFFETLTENTPTIAEGALKEAGIIGDCLVARKMRSNSLIWNPPLDLSDPYNVPGGTLSVKFSVTDLRGKFIYSENVRLVLFDENGVTIRGPFSFSSNPNKGIAITGKQYHHNLKMKGIPVGNYTLMVIVESPDLGVVAFRQLIVTSP